MARIIVFRVEHKRSRRGPYRHARAVPDYLDHTNTSSAAAKKRWPAPQHQRRLVLTHERCGFPTLKSLLVWFEPRVRSRLEADGFRIVELTVDADTTWRSTKQCVFDAKRARRRRVHPWSRRKK